MKETLKDGYENIQWGNIFYYMKLTISDKKILNFQYKLLHKISVCNCWLNKLKIKDHSSCDKCGHVLETLDHLYWDCPSIHIFLKKCFDMLKSFGFVSNINICSFIIGHGILSSEVVLYEIFAIIKYYIYTKSLTLSSPTFQGLLRILKSTFNVEKQIATKNGEKDMMKFNFKWKNFLNKWNNTPQIL